MPATGISIMTGPGYGVPGTGTTGLAPPGGHRLQGNGINSFFISEYGIPIRIWTQPTVTNSKLPVRIFFYSLESV
jgi:hypothetical protein